VAPQRYSVAIVEDDPSMRRSLERLLNAHGFAAEVFSSAEAFLDCYPDNLLACVVLDIHLPGMSGLQLQTRLNVAGSILPVIVITGIDDEDVRAAAIHQGCTAYLRKPFPASLLIDAVNDALTDLQHE